MSENSSIEWTDHTFNIRWGCTKVGPECRGCYAEAWARRWGLGWGANAEPRKMSDANWRKPLQWDRRAAKAGAIHRVFCSSMADVFEQRDNHWRERLREDRERLWPIIEATPNLLWLLLTKRPENVLDMVPESWLARWPRNAAVGVSAGTQATWDRHVPALATIPAPIRFVSAEPLLERVSPTHLGGDGVNWLITGGESGPTARPSDPDWFRALRDASAGTGCAFLFKQWGEHDENGNRVGKKVAGRLLDGEVLDGFPSNPMALGLFA